MATLYCHNCGKERGETPFCPHCGATMSDAAATVTVQSVNPGVPTGEKGGQAVAALVLGIVSVVMIWIPFSGIFIGGITGILGIIFGALSRKSARRTMALWGMWLGIAGLIIGFIEIICGIIFVASIFSQSQFPQNTM